MSDMAKRYDEYDATEKQVADSAMQQLKRWIDEASHLVFFWRGWGFHGKRHS